MKPLHIFFILLSIVIFFKPEIASAIDCSALKDIIHWKTNDQSFIFNLDDVENAFVTNKKINRACAIYLVEGFYTLNQIEKAQKYTIIAYNNVTDFRDEKFSRILYYKILLSPEKKEVDYQLENLRNRSPEQFDLLLEEFERLKRLAHNFIKNPLDQKPLHIHDYWTKKWGLYKRLNELNVQLSEYKQYYQDGTVWTQNYENVLKLYQSLIFLKQENIKDTKQRLQTIQSLKKYYEIAKKLNETKNNNRLSLIDSYRKANAYFDESNKNFWKQPPFTDTENIKQKLNELLIFKDVYDFVFSNNKLRNDQRISNLLEKISQLSTESLKKKLEEPLTFYSQILNLNTIESKISFFNQEIKKSIDFENDFNWKNIRHKELNQFEKEINQNCIKNIWQKYDQCYKYSPLSKACQQVKEYHYLSGRSEINEPITHKIIDILFQLKKSGIDIGNRDKGYQIAKNFFLEVHSADKLAQSKISSNKEIASQYSKAYQFFLQANLFFNNKVKRVVDLSQTRLKADAFKIMNEIDVYIDFKKQIPDEQTNKSLYLQISNQYIDLKYKNFLELLNLYYRCIEQRDKTSTSDTIDPRLRFINSPLWNRTIGNQLLKKNCQIPMICSIQKDITEIKRKLKIFINEPDTKMSASSFIKLVQRINQYYRNYFEANELLSLQKIVSTLQKISYDNNILLCQQFKTIQQLPTKALRKRFSKDSYQKYTIYKDQLFKINERFETFSAPHHNNIQKKAIINYCESLSLKKLQEFGKQYNCTSHENLFPKLKMLYHETVMKIADESFQKKQFTNTIKFLKLRLSRGVYQLLKTDAQYEDFYLGAKNKLKLCQAILNKDFSNIHYYLSSDDIYFYHESAVIDELRE